MPCIRRFPTAALLISYAAASAGAEPNLEVCRTPQLAFGGAGGTPVSVQDAAVILEPATVGELHVEVVISHTWVSDIVLELTSPEGTTLRLHDGDGGDADDLDLIYSDQGVPNGAEPFDFGCYMQPAGSGVIAALADFAGQTAQGTWTLHALDDYPSSDDGVIEQWCLRVYGDPPPPAPAAIADLACLPTSDGAVLSWTNAAVYETVEVRVDGSELASLPGSSEAYAVTGGAAGVQLEIEVRGIVPGSAPPCAAACGVTPLGPPPVALTERLVLVLIDGLRYSEGLGDPERQHVPNMDALAAQGTLIEPFLNDGPTVTVRSIPAIMSGSWQAPIAFFDPDCGEDNQYSPVPYVHEYFRLQLDRPAEDCLYVIGPYCPWRGSFHASYGPGYWPLWIATTGGDDANWTAAQQVLETLQPTFLTLYLPDVDSAGHSGDWDAYIAAIENADAVLGALWDWLQQDAVYGGNTTVIVTNDHGRHWYDFSGHGDDCSGCRTIQLLAVGPGIKQGHVSRVERTTTDITPTIGALLGFQTEYAGGAVMTEILEQAGSCDSTPGCADSDADGRRDDACSWWTCTAGACEATAIDFADMGGVNGACPPDGAADANDRFHALNCFSDQDTLGAAGYACEPAAPSAFNVDAGGPFGSCVPDGVCDGHDAFHALNAFEGTTTCSCSGGGAPRPDGPQEPPAAGQSAIRMRASSPRIAPGQTVEVDVFLDGALADLRGYQLHLGAGGGVRGGLELIDISIRQRMDYVFAGQSAWQAFNAATGQALVGLDTPGIAVPSGSYLATFTWRASSDAAGTFVIDTLSDASATQHRTFFFPTPANAAIAIRGTRPAHVQVDARRRPQSAGAAAAGRVPPAGRGARVP